MATPGEFAPDSSVAASQAAGTGLGKTDIRQNHLLGGLSTGCVAGVSGAVAVIEGLNRRISNDEVGRGAG